MSASSEEQEQLHQQEHTNGNDAGAPYSTSSASEAGIHFAAALEHFAKFWQSNERDRALSIENKIDLERHRAAALEIKLHKVTYAKERTEADCATLRLEQEDMKAQWKQLVDTHASATETIASLRQDLAMAHAATESEHSGRAADFKVYKQETDEITAKNQQIELNLTEYQGMLQAERQYAERLTADKETLNAQLHEIREELANQARQIEDKEDQLAQRDAELARLRPIAEYNEAIVYIWKGMPIKGKILVARELLDKNHRNYSQLNSQLEAAPGLLDACAMQTEVQKWLTGNMQQFRTQMKDFPLHQYKAATAEEVMAGEVLREFQAIVNGLLEKAQIRIICPKPGDQINPKEHTVQTSAEEAGNYTGKVLLCLHQGYYFNGTLIPAIVQPDLGRRIDATVREEIIKREEEVVAEMPRTIEFTSALQRESGDAADDWYGLLVSPSLGDSKVQVVMQAFESLIAKARQRNLSSFLYSTLIPELTTLAPLFTRSYPNVYAKPWWDMWREVWERAERWMRNDLGIEPFMPENSSPFDPSMMILVPEATRSPSEQMLVDRTAIAGFRVCKTGETVLKATVVPRFKGGR